MVSTRSGRVTNSVTPAPSRSRAKRDTANADETYEEVGQPEVSSPAPALQSNVYHDNPSPAFDAFGSPLQPSRGPSTPIQTGLDNLPLIQERVVMTVGKAVQPTPSARAAPPSTVTAARTPLAHEVKHVASIPLPDDQASDDATPSFATSDDEPAGPASPEKLRASLQDASNAPSGGTRRRGPGRLLALFTISSLLATVAIALVLAPCADRDLYAQLRSPTYERVCKTVVRVHGEISGRVEEVSWRLRAEAADRLGPLYAQLPDPARATLADAWSTLQQAHGVALTALRTAAQRAHDATAPLQQRAKDAYLAASRKAFTALAPVLDTAVARIQAALARSPRPSSLSTTTSASTAAGANYEPACLSLSDFLSVVDASPRQQQYARELWHAAGPQVAAKHKAAAWVLTCRDGADCSAAAGHLLSVAASFANIDGASFSSNESAGHLQSELATYLHAYPRGLVLVSNVGRMHSNCLAVVNAAISESGHLQMHGTPVATKAALYVFLVEDPAAEVEVWEGEAHADGEAGVKERLCKAIAAVEPETPSAPATILSFRRRLDGVLPVRKVAAKTA